MVIQKRFLSISVNCTGHTDSYFCGTGYFIQSNCDRYSNVPILCPTMCKVCPCKSIPSTDIGLLHVSTREIFHSWGDGRHRAANLDLCSTLMAIEQWGIFNVPQLLWHGPTLYNGHISEDPWHSHLMTRVWQWSCHYRRKFVPTVIEANALPLCQRGCS